jgi:hypothetical protein
MYLLASAATSLCFNCRRKQSILLQVGDYATSTQGRSNLDKKIRTKSNLEDSTKKDESLTREKIQDLTLKHQARRLEIPGGHPSALE